MSILKKMFIVLIASFLLTASSVSAVTLTDVKENEEYFDAINTLTKHLKENDKHIKILYEKNSICLTEDDEDELDDLLKK